MQDADLETIYKSALNISHFAGLRAVYDSGFYQGASVSVTPTTQDASITAPAPSLDVIVTTP